MSLILEVYDVLLTVRPGDNPNGSPLVHIPVRQSDLQLLQGYFDFRQLVRRV